MDTHQYEYLPTDEHVLLRHTVDDKPFLFTYSQSKKQYGLYAESDTAFSLLIHLPNLESIVDYTLRIINQNDQKMAVIAQLFLHNGSCVLKQERDGSVFESYFNRHLGYYGYFVNRVLQKTGKTIWTEEG